MDTFAELDALLGGMTGGQPQQQSVGLVNNNQRNNNYNSPSLTSQQSGSIAANGGMVTPGMRNQTYQNSGIIIMSPFFDACPKCHSTDVSSNQARGFSICETCGYAVNPANVKSKKQREIAERGLSEGTRNKLALIQATHLATNRKILNSNDAANHELFRACRDNDIRAIKKMLDQGYDINCSDVDTGSTPLHWAASKSQHHAIRLLVESGANVNMQNKRGLTPLHLLIINRVEPIAFWLVKKGADIRIVDNEGHTALDLALPWTQKELEELWIKVQNGIVVETPELQTVVVKKTLINEPEMAGGQQQMLEREAMKIYVRGEEKVYRTIIVSSTMTATELCDQMAEKLNLGPGIGKYLEAWERVKKDSQYLERTLPGNAVLWNLKSKWPMIFGANGVETQLHCRFSVYVKRGVALEIVDKFKLALK
eukprot:TRINITY_DN992_c0_g1_i1.p1 TRINITY_DN992_c0_g1~~TRINITY_DN992_c0_g1_i1.p1  ORF type:complete len:426 (-),score=101.81 TRINITY_DN992_c0_g1_i1:84-1361(-)